MRKLMKVLDGETFDIPPIWLMRQAGRYLPEYRETRKKAGGFLDLCYNPDLAVEVTLQPIRRFGFDASIMFSDILVIPHALGRNLDFREGEGPVLDPITVDEIETLNTEGFLENLSPVFETIGRLREELPSETTLIGFCGAPWTVATYMVAGRGTPDQAPARLFALQNSDGFQRLIDILVESSSKYLIKQIKSGADCVQIFDSWAGILGGDQFNRWCVDPVARIISEVRAEVPDAKIIGFPKGAGAQNFGYRQKTGIDCLGLDWSIPFDQAKQLQNDGPIQGLLDPLRVIAGSRALDEGVDQIMENLSGGPLVFNLGHGITPQAPITHVEQLITRVRNR